MAAGKGPFTCGISSALVQHNLGPSWLLSSVNQRHAHHAAWARDPGLRLARSLSRQATANLSAPPRQAYIN